MAHTIILYCRTLWPRARAPRQWRHKKRRSFHCFMHVLHNNVLSLFADCLDNVRVFDPNLLSVRPALPRHRRAEETSCRERKQQLTRVLLPRVSATTAVVAQDEVTRTTTLPCFTCFNCSLRWPLPAGCLLSGVTYCPIYRAPVRPEHRKRSVTTSFEWRYTLLSCKSATDGLEVNLP